MNQLPITAIIQWPSLFQPNCILNPIINGNLYILLLCIIRQIVKSYSGIPDKRKIGAPLLSYLVNFLRVNINVGDFRLNSEPNLDLTPLT